MDSKQPKEDCLTCGLGYHATIADTELNKVNSTAATVAVLTWGLVGLCNATAMVPDLLVGHGTCIQCECNLFTIAFGGQYYTCIECLYCGHGQ
jgi:hypothetical protein